MTADISLRNFHGTINNGDKLLIIQMKGSFIGNHQAVTVTSISGSTYSLQTVSSEPMLSYSASGSDRFQVIKINEYYDFTLNGGLVTCNNWDDADGSGGVLALMVNHTLTVNNGLFSVSGKGFTPEEAGVTFGVGSTGGAPNATINLNNASKAPVSTACMNGVGTVIVNQGDKGGVAGSTASAGASNSGSPVNYGGSSKPTLLVMGDPGYYQSGYGAANGGQGGGWGGKGANSNCPLPPNTGSNGVQGIAGLNGGNAGRGGNGGGAMIIKACTTQINNNFIVFDASGQHGTPGGNGGYGGAGGVGGVGGPGCCINGGTTPIPQGGNGGVGDTGAGGKGGDGGNGGATGYIWIGTKSYTTTAGARKDNFSFRAGKGGKKGWGGWSAVNTTPNNMSAMNECTGIDCSTSGGGGGSSCANAVCDPDKAMCYLSSNYFGAFSPGGNDYSFTDVSSTTFARYISKNNTGDGDLEVDIPNSCGTITTYKAYCKGDCDVLFKQIAANQNVNGYTVTKPNNTSTCSSLPTLPMSINYIDGSSGNIPLLEYVHTDINVPATLTDVTGESDNVGTFTTCFSKSINGTEFTFVPGYDPPPVQAPAGNDGAGGTTPPPPPNTGAGNPTDNVIVDDGNSWFNSGINNTNLGNAFSAVAYPNPADKDLNIELQSETNITANVTVKDVNGKEIITTKQKLQTGKNKFTLDVAKLKAGFYFVTINANNKQSVLKITIQ